MVHANVTTETVVVTNTEEVEYFNLKLTREEANFLLDITTRCGGDSLTSRRGIADGIATALYGLGLDGSGLDDINEAGQRSIYFQPSE